MANSECCSDQMKSYMQLILGSRQHDILKVDTHGSEIGHNVYSVLNPLSTSSVHNSYPGLFCVFTVLMT